MDTKTHYQIIIKTVLAEYANHCYKWRPKLVYLFKIVLIDSPSPYR